MVNLINKKHFKKIIAFQTKDFFFHGEHVTYNYTVYNKKSKYSFVTFAG